MRVLIVGSGGREHALAWAVSSSPLLEKLFVAPGNPGTAALAENVAIGALDVAALVEFAQAERIGLVIPGPEAPLVAGLADALTAHGIACCGPSAAAAALEGSKAFAKEVCDAAGIPTAAWEQFTDEAAALDFIARRGAPIVVKADGLASGKGVVVAQDEAEAGQAVRALMKTHASLVIEEHLTGEEVSLFALCDGTEAVLLGAAQDHKRIFDDDQGPNTGGMGAVSPPPGFDEAAQRAAMDAFILPALRVLSDRGTPYRGVLFAGLMLTQAGARLIEYNCRLGDPETQVLLPRLAGDVLAMLRAATDGSLGAIQPGWLGVACIAVVMAASGYPGATPPGTPITGLAEAACLPHVAIFHAGTDLRDGMILASGGRVLTVCATGPTVAAARDAAYRAVDSIGFAGNRHRRDIGARALKDTSV